MSREFWDQRFAAAGEAYVFGEAPNHFLEAHTDLLTDNSRVLCVADGEGRNSVWLAQNGHQVHATEFSPVALAKARQLAERAGVSVHFEHADVFHWEWPPAAYDAVVAIFIQFAAPAERARLFANLRGALKPGGLLLLHGYTPRQIGYGTGGPSAVENLYSEELLREAFGDMELLVLRTYEQEINEGAGHKGMSALIDLVARRPG